MDSDGEAGVREGGAGQAWEAQTGPRKFSLQLIFTSLFNLPPRVTGLPVASLRAASAHAGHRGRDRKARSRRPADRKRH